VRKASIEQPGGAPATVTDMAAITHAIRGAWQRHSSLRSDGVASTHHAIPLIDN
jgi:hypothetical protein